MNSDDEPEWRRAVVTLPPAEAETVRRLAVELGKIGNVEVLRRALTLLTAMLDAEEEEEFVLRNRVTGEVTRLRFDWQTFNRRNR